jgi:hypothetical protein
VFLANVGGQVTIGGANELDTEDENFDLTTQVFQGVLLPNFPPFDPADYGRDEPGFFALASGSPDIPPGATALPGNAAVTIDLPSFTIGPHADSLFFWNGSGAVDFQPISLAQPGVAMTLTFDPLANTESDGSLHGHGVFRVFTPDDGDALLPADGVYLISPTASVAGLSTSQPFYMLFLVDALIEDEDDAEGLEEALESEDPVFMEKNFAFFNEAASYVQENLVVPEPTGASLIVIACSGLLVWRQRNRNLPRRSDR